MTEPIIVFTIASYEFKVFTVYKNGFAQSHHIKVSSVYPERSRDESTYIDTIHYVGPPFNLVDKCIEYAENRAVKDIVIYVQGP